MGRERMRTSCSGGYDENTCRIQMNLVPFSLFSPDLSRGFRLRAGARAMDYCPLHAPPVGARTAMPARAGRQSLADKAVRALRHRRLRGARREGGPGNLHLTAIAPCASGPT